MVKPIAKVQDSRVAEVDSVIRKRENMVLYLLINYPKETKEMIQSNIGIEDLKIEENKMIFEKIMTLEEKDSEKITQQIANLEDEKIQEHVSEIMVTDYEITSVEKCTQDVILIYNKERLQNRKLEIVKELENPNLEKGQIENLEMELSDIIVKMAKIK